MRNAGYLHILFEPKTRRIIVELDKPKNNGIIPLGIIQITQYNPKQGSYALNRFFRFYENNLDEKNNENYIIIIKKFNSLNQMSGQSNE